MVNFDSRHPLPGGINLATTREKEEERERGRTLTHTNSAPPSLDDPDPVGNDKVTTQLLLHRKPEASVAFNVFVERRR
ncbi:hypothetical protein BHM03_00020394 [Ensete ventricosum]|nr:hypothetical protein BHM03_00020394 [Ensete ventricosum]